MEQWRWKRRNRGNRQQQNRTKPKKKQQQNRVNWTKKKTYKNKILTKATKINIWISEVLLRFVSSLLKVSSKQNSERRDHISFSFLFRSALLVFVCNARIMYISVYVRIWIALVVPHYTYSRSHTTYDSLVVRCVCVRSVNVVKMAWVIYGSSMLYFSQLFLSYFSYVFPQSLSGV